MIGARSVLESIFEQPGAQGARAGRYGAEVFVFVRRGGFADLETVERHRGPDADVVLVRQCGRLELKACDFGIAGKDRDREGRWRVAASGIVEVDAHGPGKALGQGDIQIFLAVDGQLDAAGVGKVDREVGEVQG